MEKLIFWIPALPLIAFVVNILFGKRVKKTAAWISIGTSVGSALIALPVINQVFHGHIFEKSVSWLSVGTTSLRFGYFINPIAAILLSVVTLVGTLIQIYAAGYMAEEKRFSRFFAIVSLFMAAMLTVVIANHYVLFFMAWEVMGLCSYLLIGFYQEKNSAADASLKAFLTTRIGDIGFFIGILFVCQLLGSLEFSKIPALAAQGHPLLPVAALFLFCGTIGKSAQFPLHVWLPDAMEGPTPVSALIHAATMVAAGVYLLARSSAIFMTIPNVLPVVATVGGITAFMAACIALTATDIKKVLAYSTISQLGFMVVAFGAGEPNVSIFHLMTHAWFKALLFLGAGSVIHGTHTQDLRQMGGLFKSMKHTAATFLIGALAIAGVPPLSGFWSKDEILTAVFHSGNHFLFALLVLTAFMTAFYMFRLVFLAFFGTPRDSHVHAHESPKLMTGPLWVLAAGSALLGLPGSPFMHNVFQAFLEGGHSAEAHAMNPVVVACSLGAGIGGILLAALFYLKNPKLPSLVVSKFQFFHKLAGEKFYFDEIYSTCFVRPFHALGKKLFRFDETVVDGAVNQTGIQTLRLSAIKQWMDQYLVDGFVNFVGYFMQWMSSVVRRIQTGLIQHYLLILLSGILFIFFFHIQ